MIISIIPAFNLTQLIVPVSMEAFINLSKGGVIYEGPISMVQYKVQSTEMIIKDPKYLVVEITLKRLFKYHLATTYVPSALLIIITTITLYVGEEHYGVTIMVHLTTMLVMFTLYQSVSDNMPKTANLKLIDIWLLYGIIVPFVTFLVETLLILLAANDDVDSLDVTDTRPNSSQRQIEVAPISENAAAPEEGRKVIAVRKRTKVVIKYAAQFTVPFATLMFCMYYGYVAYTYYN